MMMMMMMMMTIVIIVVIIIIGSVACIGALLCTSLSAVVLGPTSY